jgi:hypothetical protein
MTQTCPHCGGPVYRDHNNRRSIHCSARCAGAARRKPAAPRMRPARKSRARGCFHCGSFDHFTKTHGRAAYTGPGRRPIKRVGPRMAKRLGIAPIVPVISSWLVNP